MLDAQWARHAAEWRNPSQICSQWEDADKTDPKLLKYEIRGGFWDTLEACRATVLVTREYEHLAMALSCVKGRPRISYLRLPHPSGLAFDAKRGVVHLASTRNPNQIYDLAPVDGLLPRQDMEATGVAGRPLLPQRSVFLPGCLYIHDLAIVGGELYANSVGQNAVVRVRREGGFERAWWPRSIERATGPVFGRNHLQLNSIAAGKDLAHSYFSASTEHVGRLRPGHKNFPVDGTGVIFDGKSREVVVRGLTRPHSARLHRGKLWVDNSGYGELGIARAGRFEALCGLPGWTRGLGFYENLAFVGTSRVIPRFRQYAPGLDPAKSRCGLHIVDIKTGALRGSLTWPFGNQIFGIEVVPQAFTSGFPFLVTPSKRAALGLKNLFYAFKWSVKNRKRV